MTCTPLLIAATPQGFVTLTVTVASAPAASPAPHPTPPAAPASPSPPHLGHLDGFGCVVAAGATVPASLPAPPASGSRTGRVHFSDSTPTLRRLCDVVAISLRVPRFFDGPWTMDYSVGPSPVPACDGVLEGAWLPLVSDRDAAGLFAVGTCVPLEVGFFLVWLVCWFVPPTSSPPPPPPYWFRPHGPAHIPHWTMLAHGSL